MQNNNYLTLSTGTPTYWPARLNTMPDLLDFFVCSHILPAQLILKPSYDLSSDHSPVIAVFNSRVSIKAPYPIINHYQFKRKVEERIQDTCDFENEGDLERITSSFMDTLTVAMNESITPTTHHTSHVSLFIRNKIKEKRRYKRIYQNTLHRDDKASLNRASKDLKLLLKDYNQKKVEDFLYELDPKETGDKSLWNVTKSIKRPSIRHAPIQDSSGCWLKNNKDKADHFANHFQNQFTPFPSSSDDSDVHNSLNSTLEVNQSIRSITLNELKQEIKSLNAKKAPGHDGITARLVKILPNNAIILLTLIFNAILKIGVFPSIWKNSVIIVINKPGKPDHLVDSYRPISLLSVFSKLFERLFKTRLVPHINLPTHQFGFRTGHNTTEQCHRFVHHIQTALQEKKYCCGAFLDIMQAFDHVWHDGLLYKIYNSIPSPFYLILKSYLQNRRFLVRYAGEESSWKTIQAGVPQGSVLGPLLYTMYTADMAVDETGITGTYADDTGFLSIHDDLIIARNDLQRMISIFEQWANKWRLRVSASKSSVITFTLRSEVTLPPITINNQNLPEKIDIKYLGLTLDKKLNFAKHIQNKKTHVNLIISKYNWLIGRHSSLSLENKIILYKSIFRPMWAYCCVLWGAASKCHINKIQVLQNKFLRNATNSPWYVSNITNHKDCNIPFVKEYINENIVKYNYRLGNHENDLVISMLNETIPRRLSRRVILDRIA